MQRVLSTKINPIEEPATDRQEGFASFGKGSPAACMHVNKGAQRNKSKKRAAIIWAGIWHHFGHQRKKGAAGYPGPFFVR